MTKGRKLLETIKEVRRAIADIAIEECKRGKIRSGEISRHERLGRAAATEVFVGEKEEAQYRVGSTVFRFAMENDELIIDCRNEEEV